MPVVVTEQGLQAIRNADAGGFLIDLTDFRLTSATEFNPEINDIELVGSVLYEGRINTIEALGSNSVKFTLSLPKHFPLSGALSLSEVGIYLASGELFAHGKLSRPFEKTSEFGFDLYLVVSSARLGDVINITTGSTCSVASTPHVRTLLGPLDSQKNVVAVLDESTDLHGKGSASLAVKFGSGSLHWAFTGHTRVFTGNPDVVGGFDVFNLENETKAGYWLNDNEIVIVQIVSGPGAGESRKVRYNKPSAYEVLEQPFTNFTAQSVISVWRSHTQTLPTRDPSIPDYYMLKMGQNDWSSQVVEHSFGALVPYRLSLVGNGTSTITIPPEIVESFEVMADSDMFIVHVNGNLVSSYGFECMYNGSGKPDRIQFARDLTVLDTIDLLVFGRDDTSTGASLYWYEALYQASAETTFQLPILPGSGSSILAYVDGRLVTNFTYQGSSVVFDTPIVGELCLLPFVSYEEIGLTGRLGRTSITAYQDQVSVQTSFTIPNKKDTLVFVDGRYQKKDNYTIQNNSDIALSFALNAGSIVEVLVFYADVEAPTVVNISGRNEGPVWADPAGSNSVPNSLGTSFVSSLTDGTRLRIDLPKVPSIDHTWLFIGTQYQHNTEYEFYQFADKSVIQFKEAIPAGYVVDVVAITEETGQGHLARGVSNRVVTTTSQTYSMPVTNTMLTDSWLLFIGGTYRHRATYTFDRYSGVITLPDVIPGSVLEFWYLTSTPAVGVRTDVGTSFSALSAATGITRLPHIPSSVDDTLLFLGSVYQNKDQYVVETVVQGHPVGVARYTPGTNFYEDGTSVCAIALSSSVPNTRLVLRDEFIACCDAMWEQLDAVPGAYTLSPASTVTLGGIKVGSGLQMAGNGTLSVDTSTDLVTIPYGGTADLDKFSPNKVQGIDAYNALDMPVSLGGNNLYYTGLSVGVGGTAISKGMQIVNCWNGELGNSLGTFVRHKDDTQSAWSSWRRLAYADEIPAAVVVPEIPTYTPYTLPAASTTTLGGVKVGTGLDVAADGTLSATAPTVVTPSLVPDQPDSIGAIRQICRNDGVFAAHSSGSAVSGFFYASNFNLSVRQPLSAETLLIGGVNNGATADFTNFHVCSTTVAPGSWRILAAIGAAYLVNNGSYVTGCNGTYSTGSQIVYLAQRIA